MQAPAARSESGFGDDGVGKARFADTDDDGLPDMRVAGGASPATKAGVPGSDVGDAAAPPRMLVYQGQIRVEVARAEEAAAAFVERVKLWGGYLQKQVGADLTVRVPAAKFEEALASVRAAGRVLSERRETNDVTEEFVDLGIRVDTARRSRERLLQVLEKAEKVEDILRVERELRRLTAEIERMEGRLKYLRDRVALATLEVGFAAIAPTVKEGVRRKRRLSRFQWVNRVGPSVLMEAF
ncbi:MAG: DUF4349 domain-containing protein [Planctomycetota bacterium]